MHYECFSLASFFDELHLSSHVQAPLGVHVVCKKFPKIKIVTSEIEIGLNKDFRVIPGMGEFGDRYFGTDDDEQLVVPSQ